MLWQGTGGQALVAALTGLTDPLGEVTLPVAGGLGPATLAAQYLVLDAGAVNGSGATLSNALSIVFPRHRAA